MPSKAAVKQNAEEELSELRELNKGLVAQIAELTKQIKELTAK